MIGFDVFENGSLVSSHLRIWQAALVWAEKRHEREVHDADGNVIASLDLLRELAKIR